MAAADLFLTPVQSLQTKRRAFRVEINNPYQGSQTVSYHQEDLQVDASGVSHSGVQAESFSIPGTTIETAVYSIADPVTGTTQNISGAAIAMWLAEDYMTRATALYVNPAPAPAPTDPANL